MTARSSQFVAPSSDVAPCRPQKFVDVQNPALPAVGGPFPAEVLDGLVEIIGRDVDLARLACPAHGDVGEFSAAAIGEDMSAIDGRSLHAVDGDRVGVVEALTRELTASEDLAAAAVEVDGQLLRADPGDGSSFARDEPAVA